LQKLKLDKQYEGKVKADGALFQVQEKEEGTRPFYALLDVGLARTTTGARVFAALKGALDGGLNIPHSEKRFRGYNVEKKQYDAEEGRGYIFASHVSDYMTSLSEEDPEKYQTLFSDYLKHSINEENLEETIEKVHAAIRTDPAHVPKKSTKEGERKRWGRAPLSLAQRKDRIKQKLAHAAAKKE